MILQIIRFGLVGVIATVIDFATLIALKELVGVDVMIASAIAFCVSVAANYVLSMAFVFKSKNQNKIKEFIVFLLLSVGGLGVNEVILWLGVKLASIYYIIVKLFATVIVMVYNFITRKLFLESKEK